MELDFQAHYDQPGAFEKPYDHSCQYDFDIDGVSFSLFAHFTSGQKVKRLAFFCDEEKHPYLKAYYSYFCLWAREKEISDFESFKYPDHWPSPSMTNYPLYHFRLLYRHYKGLDQKQNKTSEGLICRCFGVKEELIQAELRKNPDLSLKDIQESLKAGAGCGSCHEDIRQTLFKTRQSEGILPSFYSLGEELGDQKRRRYGKRTPALMVLEIQKFLETKLGGQNFEILALKEMTLVLSLKDSKTDLSHLTAFLALETGFDFVLSST